MKTGRWLSLALLAITLIAGLALRLTAIDGYLTVDEPRWEERSIRFGQALRDGDLATTYQSEHPGVVTMRIGVAAQRLAEWADDAPTQLFGLSLPYRLLHPLEPGIPPLTFWARRLTALITWLATLLLGALAARLWGRGAAAAALILIALQPFYMALSRVHHLDALLTAWCVLCVLSWLGALSESRRSWWAILAGVSGGLAILTKLPGLVLLPWAGLTALIWWLTAARGQRRRRLRRVAWRLALAGAALGLTMLLLWPALRVAPRATLQQVYAGFNRQAWNPHENLNYFFGQVVPDPGAWFYPLAWLFRSTPMVWLGLLALVVARKRVRGWRALGGLLLFVLLYGAALTVAAKKFDRYLLPVFPLLAIAAAVGWRALLALLSSRWPKGMTVAPPLLMGFLAFGQLAVLLPTIPQPLAYYNPLMGGARGASRTLLYGWGEGLGEAARYLNDLEGAEELHVAAHSPNEFAPFFAGHTTLLGSTHSLEPDYFVLYASHVQRGFVPEIVSHFEDETPEFTVAVNGLEYAWVYRNTFYEHEIESLLQQIEAQWRKDDTVLVNADAAFCDHYDGPLWLWTVSGPAREDYMASYLNHLARYTNRVWLLALPELYEAQHTLLSELLEGQGQIMASLTQGETSAVCYALRPGAHFVAPRPGVRREYLLGERIVLRGYDLDLSESEPGGTVAIRLYWVAAGRITDQYKVFTHLVGPDGQIVAQLDAEPQGYALPTSEWRPGQRLVDDYEITIPDDAPPGEYELAIGMYSVESMERLGLMALRGGNVERVDHILIEGIEVE